MSDEIWDALVVGGGPAGLSAALWLARYRRRTLVLDDARPRNEAAWAVHGYPGLPDPTPGELRAGLERQATTAGASIRRCRVERIEGAKGEFTAHAPGQGAPASRRIVLAYGRRDRLPDITGLETFYGTSVFHCPDCDGPSLAGADVAVLGHDRAAATLALYLLTWARSVTLTTNGLDPDLEPDAAGVLRDEGGTVRTGRVQRLEGRGGQLLSRLPPPIWMCGARRSRCRRTRSMSKALCSA